MHNDQFEHAPQKPTIHEHGISGYEKTDVLNKPVIVNFLILTIITVVSAIVALWTYNSGENAPSSYNAVVLPLAEERVLPPLPRLQEKPVEDLRALHEREAAHINSYKWIDKTAGIVQIPVDRAIEIVAEHGLPHGREAHIPGQGQQPAAAAPAVAQPIAPLVPQAPQTPVTAPVEAAAPAL